MTKPLPPAEEVAEAFSLLAGRTGTPLILLCDHARNALPAGYGNLGLGDRELARHIAYDIGAEGVTRMLAAELGAPALISHYSRLLIDLNRGLDDPTLIMRLSDGAIVPGNRHLDDGERARRIDTYYRPYHGAIAAEIARAEASSLSPVLLSIHSFTPIFKDEVRPWHASVLWGRDPRLAKPLLASLEAEPGLVIGENEPYEGVLEGDTLYQHGQSRGLAHALVEIRQDLISTPAGQAEWAKRLARILARILSP